MSAPDLRVFWVLAGRFDPPDPGLAPARTTYRLALVSARDRGEAEAALAGRELTEAHRVHDCTTPDLVRDASSFAPGEVWERIAPQLPSVYDAFLLGSRGYDLDALETAGFDPS